MKDPADKEKWIVDEEGIDIPAYHLQKLGAGLWKTREIANPTKWGSSTVTHILAKPKYCGHTVNFKTRKHFKDKKSHYVPKDQWLIFENTHEAIIDEETFQNVQGLRANIRRYPDGWGEAYPLGSLLYCADCGAKMYVCVKYEQETIVNYNAGIQRCTSWWNRQNYPRLIPCRNHTSVTASRYI